MSSQALGFTAKALKASSMEGFASAPAAGGNGFVSRRKMSSTKKRTTPKPPNTQNG